MFRDICVCPLVLLCMGGYSFGVLCWVFAICLCDFSVECLCVVLLLSTIVRLLCVHCVRCLFYVCVCLRVDALCVVVLCILRVVEVLCALCIYVCMNCYCCCIVVCCWVVVWCICMGVVFALLFNVFCVRCVSVVLGVVGFRMFVVIL